MLPMQFDTIIVPAPGPLGPDGRFPDTLNGLYLGGQLRMDAAVALCRQNPRTAFVLTGGFNRPDQGYWNSSEQVHAMAWHIEKTVSKPKLELVYSLPCTHHNFVAVFQSWQGRTTPKHIGILTNAYHMPRAMELAERSAKKILPGSVKFEPLIAETILGTEHDVTAAYCARALSEQEGLDDLRHGRYTDRCLTSQYAWLKDVITIYADSLLEPDEKIALWLGKINTDN